jgi:nucleoside-triphosphatase
VGKYSVDIEGFEMFLESISFFIPSTNLIFIDEIGKMECFSNKFRKLIKEILNSNKLLIATIALKGEGFIRDIKNRNDIRLFEIIKGNRDSLLVEALEVVKILLARNNTD